jgi:hypothetical protein
MNNQVIQTLLLQSTCKKTISMIDHKFLHDILMKVNILNGQHFTVESWRCVTHVSVVNCFQKCGWDLNETDDGEDATELTIARDDWDLLKAGLSFQKHV